MIKQFILNVNHEHGTCLVKGQNGSYGVTVAPEIQTKDIPINGVGVIEWANGEPYLVGYNKAHIDPWDSFLCGGEAL